MIFPVVVAEHIFIPFLPGSQNYQLHIIRTHLIHHALDQIQPFLVCQTGYDSHHEFLLINRKSQLSLQSCFILSFFLAERLSIIILSNIFIRLRIKLIIINSIDDSPKASCPGTHQAVQSFSVKRHFDLFRIRIADSRNGIGVDNASLQQIAVFVCFQFIRGEIVIRKHGKSLDRLHIPYTLEFQIVYGDHRFHITEKFTAPEPVLQIYGNQSCLPVMAVNDVRLEADDRKG